MPEPSPSSQIQKGRTSWNVKIGSDSNWLALWHRQSDSSQVY
jgi:hypothetical protein